MLLVQFVALQIADAGTTWFFLRHGVVEANPLIRGALALSATPALVLVAAKALGIGIAFLAYRKGRSRLLHRINFLFAACVAWNLLVIALNPATTLVG